MNIRSTGLIFSILTFHFPPRLHFVWNSPNPSTFQKQTQIKTMETIQKKIFLFLFLIFFNFLIIFSYFFNYIGIVFFLYFLVSFFIFSPFFKFFNFFIFFRKKFLSLWKFCRSVEFFTSFF